MSPHLSTLMVKVYYATPHRRQIAMVTVERLASTVRLTCRHVTIVTRHLARSLVTGCIAEVPKLIEHEDNRFFRDVFRISTQLNCVKPLSVLTSFELCLLPT